MRGIIIATLLLWGCSTQAQLLTAGVSGGNDAGGGGGGYTGPADVVAAPVAFYGLRAMSAAVAGSATKLANICSPAASDANGCVDLVSNSNGTLNTGPITGGGAFTCTGSTAGTATCTIKLLYDQTGNGNDMVENTAGTARLLLLMNCMNTQPCAATNGSGFVARATFSSTAASGTLIGVGIRPGAGANFSNLLSIGSTSVVLEWSSSANTFIGYQGAGLCTAPTAADGSLHAFAFVFASAASIAATDGVSNTGLSCGTNALSSAQSVFGFLTSPQDPVNLAEAGVWATTFNTTQISNMCHNQRLFWGSSGSC